MSRRYRELATGRRAVLVEFQRRVGQRPARYTLAWADTGEAFKLDAPVGILPNSPKSRPALPSGIFMPGQRRAA